MLTLIQCDDTEEEERERETEMERNLYSVAPSESEFSGWSREGNDFTVTLQHPGVHLTMRLHPGFFRTS